MEEEKRVNSAFLRHHGRKYPKTTIVFEDSSEKSITIRADLKTAQTILFKIKREIALGKFDIILQAIGSKGMAKRMSVIKCDAKSSPGSAKSLSNAMNLGDLPED